MTLTGRCPGKSTRAIWNGCRVTSRARLLRLPGVGDYATAEGLEDGFCRRTWHLNRQLGAIARKS